jgi:2C-methyl-D-erythritol 2,4-cyclodiphosphate synthase
MLRVVVGRMSGAVANIDATLICEEPKLAPYKAEISARLGDALSAPVSVRPRPTRG